MDAVVEVTICEKSGDLHVLLDPLGDHIVTKFTTKPTGEEFEFMLPHGSWAWERAVERAARGAVFL